MSNLQLLVILLCLTFLVVYNWRRRWLYYYAFKLPGPFSLPVIGSVCVAFSGQEKIFDVLEKLQKTYPSAFRVWLGNQLCIFTSNPPEVEILLSTFLQKDKMLFYTFIDQCISSIFSSPVGVWKTHRKIINASFNQRVLNSFLGLFAKYGRMLNKVLEERGKEDSSDLLPLVWKCTLDTSCEALTGVDAESLLEKNDEFMKTIVRWEELMVGRTFNVKYHLNLFWKLSTLGKESKVVTETLFQHVKKMITICKSKVKNESGSFSEEKKFLNNVLSSNMTQTEIISETVIMFVAASETTASTICGVLLMMSNYPHIQEDVLQELDSIFGDNDRDATIEDMNRMNHLERVIKETLRLLPPAPYIARYIDKDVDLGSYVFPAGGLLQVPIWYVHRNPKVWPDPLKFDPDRFSIGEINKRPRGAYIPFSYGPRNCIGLNYAMMSMKIILSTILRQFRVRIGKYVPIEEMEIEYHALTKLKGGYQVALEKRI